jgi:hypothetical protein
VKLLNGRRTRRFRTYFRTMTARSGALAHKVAFEDPATPEMRNSAGFEREERHRPILADLVRERASAKH